MNILLTASVELVMPGVSENITVQAQAAITESIIVGEVPQVYTNVPNDYMYDLIPAELPQINH